MALRRLTHPIIFAFLFFSLVFARELEEKPDNKDAHVAAAEDARPHPHDSQDPYIQRGPYHGPGPFHGFCQYSCGTRCCSAKEFAAFSQVHADVFTDEKHYGPHPYGPRFPPYYRSPSHCHYYCGRRCCSAQEYAEFVRGGN